MNINLNKGLLVKLLIALVALAVVYSVFWFFKLGQVEKQINRLVSEHASNASISEVSVSGFPLSQKITIRDLRFNLPTPALDKRQVLVRSLEANAGIFQSEYSLTFLDEILVYDESGKESKIKFNSAPEITIAISEGVIEKLSYKDFGYKIIDAKKNQLYSADSSIIDVVSAVDESDQLSFEIAVNISQIEGFGFFDIYKNAFEKTIINALRTGEIAIEAPINAATNLEVQADVDVAITPEELPLSAEVNEPKLTEITPQSEDKKPAEVKEVAVVDDKQDIVSEELPKQVSPIAEVAADAAPSVNSESDLAELPAKDLPEITKEVAPIIVKSDFLLNAEYVVTPNQVQQESPIDITQMQETPLQYSKAIIIKSFSLKSPSQEVLLKGKVSIFPDDSLPSGNVSIHISSPKNVLTGAVNDINEMAKKIMIENEVKPVDLSAGLNDSDFASDGVDLYQALLQRVASSLENVALEVAAKNTASNDEAMQFDIKREKNLEILINETSVREILGKL